jgi:hypothetical protein
MSTTLPIVCTTSWTLVYDATVDGAFSGSIQSNGLAAMRTDTSTPVELSGFSTHDEPTPLSIGVTEKLYVRGLNSDVKVILSTDFYPPGGTGGGGPSTNVNVISSVLPTGASTSALQTAGNSSLSSIDSKTPVLGQAAMAASVPVVIASDQTAIPVSIGTLGVATESFSVETGPFTIAAGAIAYSVVNTGGATFDFQGTTIPLTVLTVSGSTYGTKTFPALSGDATGTTVIVQRTA